MARIKCPKCNQLKNTKVSDSREVVGINSIRRRRSCGCGHSFTTYELLIPKKNLFKVYEALEILILKDILNKQP